MSALLEGLTNIRKREIHLVAARLINVIRSLSRQPLSRSVTSYTETGTPITQDISGEVFDTLWNENAASQVCDLKRFSLREADYIIRTFEEAARAYAGGKTVPSFTDVNNIYNRADTVWKNKRTYAELGYTIDQTTLDNKTRDIDFYELLKELRDLDVIACWYTVYGRSGTETLLKAVSGVLDIVCELARIADGLTPIVSNSDEYEFAPTSEMGWNNASISGTQYNTKSWKLTGLSVVCSGRRSGLTQICVILAKQYRLLTMKVGTSNLEFSPARISADGVIYLSDVFYPSGGTNATVAITLEPLTGGSNVSVPKTSLSASFK